jgi:hypothetical protein
VEVIAVNTSQTVRDTALYRLGQDTFVGNIDNLHSTPDSLIYLQSGVVYRSTLKFDVSFIPEGAIVNSAELLLDRHPPTTQLTKFSHPRDSIAAHVLLSATDNNIFESRNWIGVIKEGTVHTFKVDVRRGVQLWVNGSNNGLLLRATSPSEFSSFDLYTFYNERASDSALRPRVRIVYSVIQNR